MARAERGCTMLLLLVLLTPSLVAQELGAAEADANRDATPGANDMSPEEQLTLQLRNLVTSWASAWQSQLDDIYLLHYHPLFEAEGFASRADWEASRRNRLVEPGSISIGLREFELLEWGESTAMVRFRLDYSRPGYADRTWKQLLLARNGELWQILRENNLAVERVPEP